MVLPLRLAFFFLLLSITGSTQQVSRLKAIIYDMDGFDIGQTNLPDGDYSLGDLTYQAAANPLGSSEVLGDRVLQLDLNWQTGSGEFAKAISRFIELDAADDRLNFYLYNPLTNTADTSMDLVITEDDNGSGVFETGADDKWHCSVPIPRSGAWQLISAPLSAFTDSNTGGNGIFDAGFTNNAGKLFSVSLIFSNSVQSTGPDRYYVDMICFSEGPLPIGPTILDLPVVQSNDSCALGALTQHVRADSTPIEIEGLLPPGKRLTYVNWFLNYSETGTTPNVFPGMSTPILLQQGYRPIITWEMMFASYPRLDPVQPRLDKIVNGNFDTYIDAFADHLRLFNDTVILRIFHEFEGDWYSWSLTENGQNPALYIAAFRHVVDRFRIRGATKVLWMWCVNAEPKPYTAYNWIVSAYPGDDYVDIVATDVYNHPNLGIPPWQSFRYGVAESYYYLAKYFPGKPLFICEVGCRERDTSEDITSQSKADWLCAMSRDLQTYFNKARALVFFSEVKEHDWRINSSPTTLDAFRQCLWNSNYFGEPAQSNSSDSAIEVNVYPDPFLSEVTLQTSHLPPYGGEYEITVTDISGRTVLRTQLANTTEPLSFGYSLASGMYIIDIRNHLYSKKIKVIKAKG